MLVTSLSLLAEFISDDTSSSAFVYGLMSFMDKLSTGLGIFFIQHFTPDGEMEHRKFYGQVLLYCCGGAGVLCILVTIPLFYVQIGRRRHHRQTILVSNTTDLNENVPLLDENSPLLG